jgi:TP53 regulating kinase-like protein
MEEADVQAVAAHPEEAVAAPPALSLLGQGAEARLFACLFLGAPCVLKERFAKAYRQPQLDARITRERNAAEARCLARCRRAGVDAPAVLFADARRARLFLERVDGPTV